MLKQIINFRMEGMCGENVKEILGLMRLKRM
jgi:hypothetical protein